MGDYIKSGDLNMVCNIPYVQITGFSVCERINTHAEADITASMEMDDWEVIRSELNSQPIKISAEKDGNKFVLFYGVIYNVSMSKESEYLSIRIQAKSTSWMMDLEKKSRSFQDVEQSVSQIMKTIAQENSFHLQCSAKDQKLQAPLIQYRETDWEFILRLASHLGVHAVSASNYEGQGVYIGFPTDISNEEPEAVTMSWCMDRNMIRADNWRTRTGTYYKITCGQIYHLGESIIYRHEMMRIYHVEMILEKGILRCTYHLANENYQPVSVRYNQLLAGVELTGTVLERAGEQLTQQLDIDEAWDAGKASFFVGCRSMEICCTVCRRPGQESDC